MWGIWGLFTTRGSIYTIPKAIFYLLKVHYNTELFEGDTRSLDYGSYGNSDQGLALHPIPLNPEHLNPETPKP